MSAQSCNLQLLLCITFVTVTTVFFLFTLNTSHFDLLTSNYRGARNIANPESKFYELKYGKSIFYEKHPSWGNRNLLKRTNKALYKAFKQRITDSEYKEYVEILNAFKEICDKNNLTFMLYGGSLLGSYRHFGIIPWDDDFDVLINRSEKSRLLKVLANTSFYMINLAYGKQWKFYKKPESKISKNANTGSANVLYKSNMKWSWPFIDIFFFAENDTHIWDEHPGYSSTYVYPKSEVFPLTLGIFEHLVVPVPKCTRKILSKTYQTDRCVTPAYSHRNEKPRKDKQISVPCKRLYRYVPFVFETVKGQTVLRKLVLNGKLFYWTKTRNGNCGNI